MRHARHGSGSLAILVGKQLGSRLPDRVIKLGAVGAFAVFGLILLIQGIRG
jgi:putative Ca2+/H+ antiporter (TMEM165/GDT1 family)